jgi:hypothetical protein
MKGNQGNVNSGHQYTQRDRTVTDESEHAAAIRTVIVIFGSLKQLDKKQRNGENKRCSVHDDSDAPLQDFCRKHIRFFRMADGGEKGIRRVFNILFDIAGLEDGVRMNGVQALFYFFDKRIISDSLI